jgi:hypothetical protein
VPPSLVGLYFNCLAGDHIVARCTSPSCCLFCLSTKHRARNCKHHRPPRRLSSDRVRERTHPRQLCPGRQGVDNGSGVRVLLAR